MRTLLEVGNGAMRDRRAGRTLPSWRTVAGARAVAEHSTGQGRRLTASTAVMTAARLAIVPPTITVSHVIIFSRGGAEHDNMMSVSARQT